jgi:hypothetical protein
MDIFSTTWLYAIADAPNLNAYATHTIGDLPRGTAVWACIALSMVTDGVDLDNNTLAVGAAGTLVSSWEVYKSDGTTQAFNNTDQANNGVLIYDCASVTFQLTVNWAEAYAQATLFSL